MTGAAPFIVLLIGASASRFGRAAGLVALGAALVATGVLAESGRTGSAGTFDADPFSLFLGGLIVLELTLTWVAGQTRERPWKTFAVAAALFLVVSTRSLLWAYVGFEAFSLLVLRRRTRSVGSSGLALLGLLLLATSSGTTDLAALESTSDWSRIGFLLFTAGLGAKWLFASSEAGFASLGAGIALVSLWIRAASWAPELPAIWIPAGWSCILIGGVGCALSGRTPAFLAWLAISQIGVAALGISGGAPSLPHVMLHLAASTVTILLVSLIVESEKTRSSLALWGLALSAASVPPMPGFVTKVGLLSALPLSALVAALVGSFLVGVGCARLLTRTVEGEHVRVATVAAVVLAIALGVFPNALFTLATRAAEGLF